jgi:hypothetical protein
MNEQSCKSGWVKVLLDTTKILTAFLLTFTLVFVLPAVSAVSLYVRSDEFASVSGVILQKDLSYRSSGGGSSRRGSGGSSKSKYCGFNYEYTVNNIKYNGNRLTLHSDDNKYHYFLWSIPFCPGYDSPRIGVDNAGPETQKGRCLCAVPTSVYCRSTTPSSS